MKMKKFINRPEDIAEEIREGIVMANSEFLQLVGDGLIVRKKPKPKGKVSIVFGQGLGHEPGYDAMVGYGFHDVEVTGGIFACAGADRIYEGIRYAWEQSGNTPVLCLISNHEGDVMNGNMAIDMARDEGMDVESVLLFDDIASALKGDEENRRGMAGTIFSFKTAGALAEEGKSRDEIIEKTIEVNASTRTLAVALRGCTNPASGELLFSLAEDELIIGPGVHGEAGPEGPMKMATANEVMDIVAERLIQDGEFKSGDDVLIFVNGCGATTMMELFLLYRRLDQVLKDRGINPYKPLVASLITTQEMAGFSLSMCKANEEIKRLWDFPVDTPCFKIIGNN